MTVYRLIALAVLTPTLTAAGIFALGMLAPQAAPVVLGAVAAVLPVLGGVPVWKSKGNSL